MSEGNGHKLHYEIRDRRPLLVSGNSSQPGQGMPDRLMEMIDVAWTHDDGFPDDVRELPFKFADIDAVLAPILNQAVRDNIISERTAALIRGLKLKVFSPHSHPSARDTIGVLKVPDGKRPYIGDQINVPEGTPNSIVAMMLEEKRPVLARALGVEP